LIGSLKPSLSSHKEENGHTSVYSRRKEIKGTELSKGNITN
jgi:hypothetical protein